MKVKLSALALGITLAYGMTAAMAADAYIEQNGSMNHAVIDQYNNDGSDVSASIVTSGWGNNHSIDQTRSDRVWARINAPGSFNTATINQSRIDYGGAEVYQAASGSNAQVNQSRGAGYGYYGHGSSQWAFIKQNDGWGHDARIVQTGKKVEADITQSGVGNVATVDQRGNGIAFNEADITQNGANQYASVRQDGHNLIANVNQRGVGNVALVDMRGNGHTATVVQNGWGNVGIVNQRN